jgi:DNA polymerase-3 subunit epsilon
VAIDPFSGHRILALDLETTGLSKRVDRIVEFALVGSDAEGNQILIEKLVNPSRLIPREASRVHGITDADVADAGSFAEYAEEIVNSLQDTVVVGHNIVKFDWPFLRHEFARIGIAPPEPKAIIDTLQISRRLKLPGRHTLGALAESHGIDLTNAHRAGADAGASLLLLYTWSKQYPREFGGNLEDLQTWIQNPSRGTSELGPGLADLEPLVGTSGKIRVSEDDLILAFGKHRSMSLRQVSNSDPSYIYWLTSNNGPFGAAVHEVLRAHLE